MASETVSYTLDDGTAVGFEFEPGDSWVPAGAADEIVGRVKDAVRPAVTAARAVLEEVVALAPGDVAVKFGVKVNGTAHWLVARASTEASFEITLTWHHDKGHVQGALGQPPASGTEQTGGGRVLGQ